ncbi:hypothetical protein AGMMS49959_11030 [Planctomycetales bacterium]|nr:hypothetical protein AGMMS49959_11030 [Planctomycetales bacterium]
MAINRVEINDFLAFRGGFAVDFCSGTNVVIGSNGTGKTTLLKVMYAASKYRRAKLMDTSMKMLLRHFDRVEGVENIGKDVVRVSFDNRVVEYDIVSPREEREESVRVTPRGEKATPSVFIPAAEMLSHSKGFLALCYERMMPFDATQIDIIAKAELGEANEVLPLCQKLLDIISRVIDGKVIYENDAFYVQKTSGKKISFPFEAEGFRKFGLLWKLLRNGLLEKGTILFWDEPEANINSELIPVLVDVLLELSRNGVQIFAATHSEMLADYFAVRRGKSDQVKFYSLYKDQKSQQIRAAVDDRFDLLDHNLLTKQSVALYEEELMKGLSNG